MYFPKQNKELFRFITFPYLNTSFRIITANNKVMTFICATENTDVLF